MTAFDYRRNAIHRAGGPEHEAAVEAVARFLHGQESIRMHEGIWQKEPCMYCWIRAGNSLQALRDAGFETVQPVGEVTS